MKFSNADELFDFISSFDGYGLVVTDEDILKEACEDQSFDDED